MSEKLDLKKSLKHLYNPPAKFGMVEVPPLNFIMLDGHGDPNTSVLYPPTVEALYGMAYTIKFAVKKTRALDFSVMPLEGLWWMENMAEFSMLVKDRWDWTMMILQPETITPEDVEAARLELKRKKPEITAQVEKIRFERYIEGVAAQVMYTGAYADEGPTIAAMHQFIYDQGYALTGKHHEIYLGDPRRTAPEKLKTIIRQPARKI